MNTRPVCFIVLMALLLCALAVSSRDGRAAATQAERNAVVPVHELTLDNGFRILVVSDHRIPRVGASLWYRVGGLQEPVGQHGSTHFLEHAIHQGTTTVGTTDFEAERPLLQEIDETERKLQAIRNRERNRLRERDVFPDDFAWPAVDGAADLQRRLYELEDVDSKYREFWAEFLWYHRSGGIVWRHTDPVNATTGLEHMEMDMDLPSTHLELFFRLEADRMVNAVLRGWEAQRFTVFEQLLNGRSNPDARFSQALDGVTGGTHPTYVIGGSSGHARDFASFTRADMLRIYDDYFVPNNATLVLAGDTTPAIVEPLAKRYFGRIPRGPEPPARMDVEAELRPGGTVRLDWTEPLSPRVLIRHRIPGVGHPDRPVFDALAALVRGRHGMLAAKFTERGLPASAVTSMQASAGRLGSPAVFTVTAGASRDEDLPQIEAGMLALFGDLRSGRIDATALERGRIRHRLEWDQVRSSRGVLSFHLGNFEVMDSWKTLQTFMDARERASVADIQRVANRYLLATNRIVATTRRVPPTETGAGAAAGTLTQ